MHHATVSAPEALTPSEINGVRALIASNIRGDEIYGIETPKEAVEGISAPIGAGRLKHFIVTRFNLWDENLRRSAGILEHDAYAKWVSRRITLFNDLLLPTLSYQINSDFKMLLFFDVDIDENIQAFVERLKNTAS